MFTSMLWNLAGSGLPLLAGLWAVPVLDRALGTPGLGVLALAWALVGYFSLLDLGLGRALTRAVAQAHAEGLPQQWVVALIARLGWLLWLLGIAGGALVAAASPGLAANLAPDNPELAAQLPMASLWLALGLPWVVVTAAWRGVLEGLGRFRELNLIRIPLGTALFVVPAILVLLGGGLGEVMLGLLLTRLLGWWVHRRVAQNALRVLPSHLEAMTRPVPSLAELLRFGGWLTVSNVVGPLMVYADRFAIAGLMTASAVAVYVAPYEVVTRLSLLAAAVAGVLFPLVAGGQGLAHDASRQGYRHSLTLTSWTTGAAAIWLFVLAEPGLHAWLGPHYAEQGTPVAQWLLLGVWLNALGMVAVAAVQAVGRADWVAKLHLLELPFYGLALLWASTQQSLSAIAMAWALRAAVDALILMAMVQRLSGSPWPRLVSRELYASVVLGTGLLLGWLLTDSNLIAGLVMAGLYSIAALACSWHATRYLARPTLNQG